MTKLFLSSSDWLSFTEVPLVYDYIFPVTFIDYVKNRMELLQSHAHTRLYIQRLKYIP